MAKGTKRASMVRRATHTVLESLEGRRLLSAGSLDTSFGSGGIVTTSFNGATNDLVDSAIHLQSGKSLVAGTSNGLELLARYDADGSRDLSFGNDGYVLVDQSVLSQISSIKEEPDGTIIAAGTVDDTAAVARFNADGSVDSSFGSGGVTTIPNLGTGVIDVAVDSSSGSIVATNEVNGDFGVAELNPDGSINSGFGNGAGYADIDFGSDQDIPRVIAVDHSSIYVAGSTIQPIIFGGQPTEAQALGLAKLQQDGQLDPSFGDNGEDVQIMGVGGLQAATPTSIDILSNGNVLLGGSAVSDSSDLFLYEVDSTGQVDSDFNNGLGLSEYAPAGSIDNSTFGITTDASGNIYLAGQTDGQATVTKFTADGQPDLAYGDGNAQVLGNFGGLSNYQAIWSINGNQIQVVGNEASSANGTADFVQAVYNADSTSDTTFGDQGFATDNIAGPQTSAARAVVQQSDGKLVAAGTTLDSDGNPVIALARYNADGSLDTGFGNGGQVTTDIAPQDVDGVVVAANGDILVGFTSFNGNDDDLSVAAFSSDGSVDSSFGSNGVASAGVPGDNDQLTSVGISPDGGTVYLAGYSADPNTGDLNFEIDSFSSNDGSAIAANSFDLGNDPADGFSTDVATGMSVESNGSIILSGISFDSSGNQDVALARVNSDLSLDASYGNGGVVIDQVDAADLNLPVKVATDSAGNAYVSVPQGVVKFDASGNRVNSGFGDASGVATYDFGGDSLSVSGISIGSDGSITLGGTVEHQDGTTSDGAVRFDSTGTLDSSFGSGGTSEVTVRDSSDGAGFTVQSDGNLVLAGSSDGDFALVRIVGPSQVQTPPPPVANAGPDQEVNEGTTVNFNGGASTGDDLTYSWDLNGDGVYGDATGPTASYTYNDNGSVTVSLQVTDAEGRMATDTLTVTIDNVAPTASVSGPSSLTPGQAATFNFGATDPSSVDQASNFTYDINWGDGTPDMIVVGSANIAESHVFTTNANDTVTVTATDKDSGQSAAATTGVAITAPSTVTVTTQPDPTNPGQTMLVVEGTAGDDVIELDHSQQRVNKVLVQTLTVTSNGVAIFSSTASFSRIQVFANSGNDSVTHGGGFKYAVEEFGGDGNDTLKAGQSGDILVGGAGDDSLVSGAGNDVEIGGMGADKIAGDAGQDLLISGYTSYDNDPTSLMAISAEWTSADDFNTRIAALQAGVGPGGSVKLISDDSSNATVFDDGVKDTLNGGGSDSDWLLYNYSGGGTYDKAAGNTTGDVLEDI